MPQRLRITAVDEDCAASGCPGAIDVPPTVTDEVTIRQIDSHDFSGPIQHPRPRLSAETRLMEIRATMKTGFDSIQHRDQSGEPIVHCIYNRTSLGAAADVGLVTNDY